MKFTSFDLCYSSLAKIRYLALNKKEEMEEESGQTTYTSNSTLDEPRRSIYINSGIMQIIAVTIAPRRHSPWF